MDREIKKSVKVSEPTFLSPLDIHFRMLSGNRSRYTINELKQIRESIISNEHASKKVR